MANSLLLKLINEIYDFLHHKNICAKPERFTSIYIISVKEANGILKAIEKREKNKS